MTVAGGSTVRGFIGGTLLARLRGTRRCTVLCGTWRKRRVDSRTSVPGRHWRFSLITARIRSSGIEWWYVTANLKDADGATYGVQWTLFRQANKPGDREEGWASRQLCMAHAAVTSAETHRFAEAFARGGVGQAASTRRFAAWIDAWQMRARSARRNSRRWRCSVGGDFSYALRLDSDRRLVLQGDGGYSRKSEQGQASYHYSQPYSRRTAPCHRRQDDRGHRTRLARSRVEQPAAGLDQTGWDWFSLHLIRRQADAVSVAPRRRQAFWPATGSRPMARRRCSARTTSS